jgi:UDP-N-acetyl-D-glucosamine dehydrogenase
VLIVTDHSAYDWNWIAQHADLIVDTRNATKNVTDSRATIVSA